MQAKDSEQTNLSWLESQGQNSWQVELLISGGMMISLWHLPSLFLEKMNQAMIITDYSTSHAIIVVGLIMASRALLIGFCTNLLLRTIWLTLLGVHFAYPKGINYARLNYSTYFQEKSKQKGNATNRILKIEKLSSLAFSITIMITVTAIGTIFILWILYAYILDWMLPEAWVDSIIFGYLLLTFFAALAFGFLDFIFFGTLKKSNFIQRLYYPISRILSFLNFTWIFAYEWHVLASNIKRWRIYLVMSFYFFIAFVITLEDMGEVNFIKGFMFDDRMFKELIINNTINSNEYDEYLEKGMFVKGASIPTEIISQSYLPLFVPYQESFDIVFQRLIDEMEIITDWDLIEDVEGIEKNSEKYSDLFNLCFEVVIDGQEINNLSWYYRRHPMTKQLGFHTKIDIDSIGRGEHLLITRFAAPKNNIDSNKDYYLTRHIPFWKEN